MEERRRAGAVDGGRRRDGRGAAAVAAGGLRGEGAATAAAPLTRGRDEAATSERERVRPVVVEPGLGGAAATAPPRASAGVRTAVLPPTIALFDLVSPVPAPAPAAQGVPLAISRCFLSERRRSSLAAVESLRSPGVLGASADGAAGLEAERGGVPVFGAAALLLLLLLLLVVGAGSIDARGRARRPAPCAGATPVPGGLSDMRRLGVALVELVAEDEAEDLLWAPTAAEGAPVAFFCARSSSRRRLRRSAPVSFVVVAGAEGGLGGGRAAGGGRRGGDGPMLPRPRRSPSATTMAGSAGGAAAAARMSESPDSCDGELRKGESSSMTVRVEHASVEVDASSGGRSTLVGWRGDCRPSSSVLVDSARRAAVGGLWSRLRCVTREESAELSTV